MSSKLHIGIDQRFLTIPIQSGEIHVDVILPADMKLGLGPTRIARVSVPWATFMKRSILGHPTNLYVVNRI